MRKAVIAAVAATVLLVVAAPASAHTHGQLHARLASLQKQINVLKNRTTTMSAELNCISWIAPLTQYGDVEGSFGYSFDNMDGAGPFLTSAVDFSEDGDPIDVWAVVLAPDCWPRSTAGGALRGVQSARGIAVGDGIATHKTRPE